MTPQPVRGPAIADGVVQEDALVIAVLVAEGGVVVAEGEEGEELAGLLGVVEVLRL